MTDATPMMMPSIVRNPRSLLLCKGTQGYFEEVCSVHIVLMESLKLIPNPESLIPHSSSCLGNAGQGLGRILDVGCSLVSVRDMPVAQRDVAAAVLGDLRVVGDEDDGASFGMQLLEQYQNLERGAGVQVTRRFVGQDDGRDRSPGRGRWQRAASDRRTSGWTLCASGGRPAPRPPGPRRHVSAWRKRRALKEGVVHQRELHVFHGSRFGQQVVTLEYEADLAVAQRGTAR